MFMDVIAISRIYTMKSRKYIRRAWQNETYLLKKYLLKK
jgi:hypothetical protein